jgi:diguanylate cyclase (GGDEF)-like protein/PAS domain S-box-containing protein
MKLRVSRRHTLLFGLGVFLVVLAAVSAIGIVRSRQADEPLQALLEQQSQKTGLAGAMFRMAEERLRLVREVAASDDPASRAHGAQRYRTVADEFQNGMRKLAAAAEGDGERSALDAILAATRRADEVLDHGLELVFTGDAAGALNLLDAAGSSAQAALDAALNGWLDASRAAARRAVERARSAEREAVMLIALVSLLVVAGAGSVAVLVMRQVRRTENELQVEKELAQVTLHSIGDGVITTDAQGHVEYLNPVAEQYTGWKTDEARGRLLAEIYRIVDERTGQEIDGASSPSPSSAGQPGVVSVTLLDRNGRECPIRYSQAPIRNRDGHALGKIVVFHDISPIRAMAQQLLWQASHDALTGLVNRREFERRLTELIDTARVQHREHALMFMDMDNFKAVNDTCGHSAGDELLRQLTSVMLSRMRGSDTLARLGGDEFGALLESCPFEQALRIANAMRETVRDFRFVWEDKTFSVGVSIGLVPIGAESGDLSRVMSLADACCYEAKNKGRDRVQAYRPEDQSEGKHGELEVVSQISQAFELGRFRLYRQRIVPLAQGAAHEPNYEVLIRMVDKAGNLIPPTGFMPAAERYNLLTSIERWVVSSLIEYLHTQYMSGAISREPHERGYYSVNLSGASINDRSLPDFLRNLLTRYQLPHGLLCFEITETTAISNLTAAAELMRELKGMGCRFALDDFGTGMSSFAYLKYLPVDVLKIAGTFVRDMATDPMDYAIVDSINRISHILGIQTVAEEVEDAQTLAKLTALKVDFAQGYFIAEPQAMVHQPTGQPVELASA